MRAPEGVQLDEFSSLNTPGRPVPLPVTALSSLTSGGVVSFCLSLYFTFVPGFFSQHHVCEAFSILPSIVDHPP